jgi:hypothetical protein
MQGMSKSALEVRSSDDGQTITISFDGKTSCYNNKTGDPYIFYVIERIVELEAENERLMAKIEELEASEYQGCKPSNLGIKGDEPIYHDDLIKMESIRAYSCSCGKDLIWPLVVKEKVDITCRSCGKLFEMDNRGKFTVKQTEADQ